MVSWPLIFAFCFCWFVGSQVYAHIGQRMAILRLNFFKGCIALVLFFLTALFLGRFEITPAALFYLALSGVIGFAIGDLFIFRSFSQLGPSKTLMLAAFEPFIIALISTFYLSVGLKSNQWAGLLLLFLCVFFLSRERKKTGDFSWKLIGIALIGISLDGIGVIFSKKAFMVDSELNSALANIYRILPALFVLYLINVRRKHSFTFLKLQKKEVSLLVIATFFGNFLSLGLYLHAISVGNPAIVAAVAGAITPMMATTYEHIRDKKKPSLNMGLAFLSMLIASILLLW